MHDQHEKLEQILASFEQPDNSVLQNEMQQWIAASEENRLYYEEVKKIWFTGNEPGDMEYDIENEKKRFWDRVDGMKIPAPVRKIGRVWKIAVAALLIIIAGTGIWTLNRSSSKRDEFIVMITGKGQRDSVILADGTHVILNGNTRIRYTQVMGGVKREVWLDKGEAFFDVHKDPQHPFLIHADTAEVEVLGTSFDVRLAPHQIGVAVATGKVKFGIAGTDINTLLLPGLTGTWERGENTIVRTQDANMLAWRTGRVRFSDMPLGEVFTTLEYMYNIEVDMIPSLKKTRVTATIDNLSLEKMLRLLEASLDIAITKVDSITFKVQPVRM